MQLNRWLRCINPYDFQRNFRIFRFLKHQDLSHPMVLSMSLSPWENQREFLWDLRSHQNSWDKALMMMIWDHTNCTVIIWCMNWYNGHLMYHLKPWYKPKIKWWYTRPDTHLNPHLENHSSSNIPSTHHAMIDQFHQIIFPCYIPMKLHVQGICYSPLYREVQVRFQFHQKKCHVQEARAATEGLEDPTLNF